MIKLQSKKAPSNYRPRRKLRLRKQFDFQIRQGGAETKSTGWDATPYSLIKFKPTNMGEHHYQYS